MDKELIEELKEWNAKVETEHEEMINEYETRIDKLERALIEEDWKHRQLPKQIVEKIRERVRPCYVTGIIECAYTNLKKQVLADHDLHFVLDNILKEYQGDGE